MEPLGFFEALRFLSLVLEPASDRLVHQFARGDDEIAIFKHHVGDPRVEIADVRNLSCGDDLCEMADFSSYRKVIICELVRSHLQFFRLFAYTTNTVTIISSHLQRVDSLVLLGEGLELITKLGSSLAAFNFDLPSQSFKVKNVLGTFVHLNREELRVVGLLV